MRHHKLRNCRKKRLYPCAVVFHHWSLYSKNPFCRLFAYTRKDTGPKISEKLPAKIKHQSSITNLHLEIKTRQGCFGALPSITAAAEAANGEDHGCASHDSTDDTWSAKFSCILAVGEVNDTFTVTLTRECMLINGFEMDEALAAVEAWAMVWRRCLLLRSKARLKDVWVLLRYSAELLWSMVMGKILCLLKNQLTWVFHWFCLKGKETLWIQLVWVVVGELLMRVLFEE